MMSGEGGNRTTPENTRVSAFSDESAAKSNALTDSPVLADASLVSLVDVWPSLTEAQRQAILAIAQPPDKGDLLLGS